MSEFRTKKGLSLFVRCSPASAIGPAVPRGSTSCEKIIFTPNFFASSANSCSICSARGDVTDDKARSVSFCRQPTIRVDVYLFLPNPRVCSFKIYWVFGKWVPPLQNDTLHVAPAQEVSFEEHCQYKYLFNFRGVAASFRLKHILLCKSVVFHVGNEWQEFFYPALKPWIHYIPVDSSASKEQLQELIEFASHHDDVVREIAENGYKMIWNHLRMKDVSCYWRKLLKKYASLQTFKPSRDEMLVEIKG
ncbi:hypothetical protein HUJ05_005529 [Dendroctonus ponderosae]|nr:hypothetical protein HUJ05_005529 [Dendroctonus ponderosae]